MVLIKQKHNTVLVKDGNGILNNILNSKSLPELHSFDIADDLRERLSWGLELN